MADTIGRFAPLPSIGQLVRHDHRRRRLRLGWRPGGSGSGTFPLVAELVPVVDQWAAGKSPDAWIFAAPEGGPLRESNWKRSVGWTWATTEVGVRPLRVHDLRHTAASIWLAQGADPKVVQRVLGHATASMTMDLYGHLLDANLWEAARRIGGISGAFPAQLTEDDKAPGQ